MSEKPHYEPIEELVLRDAWNRMSAAKASGNTTEYDEAKRQLTSGLEALGNASPEVRRKYQSLLDNG